MDSAKPLRHGTALFKTNAQYKLVLYSTSDVQYEKLRFINVKKVKRLAIQPILKRMILMAPMLNWMKVWPLRLTILKYAKVILV